MRVVVADDSPIERDQLHSRLRDLGHDVVGKACNGKQAVELCREHKPDLAILDIQMPLLKGNEAALIIAEEKTSGRVVIATSQGQSDVRDFTKRNGFGLIIKPYGPGQFEKKLMEALGEPLP